MNDYETAVRNVSSNVVVDDLLTSLNGNDSLTMTDDADLIWKRTSDAQTVIPVFLSLYSVLFIVGFNGNLWVITTLLRLFFCDNKKHGGPPKTKHREPLSVTTHKGLDKMSIVAIDGEAEDGDDGGGDGYGENQSRRPLRPPVRRRRTGPGENPNQHLFMYIFCLSMVDLCVLSTLPFFLIDMSYDHWMFSLTMCRVYMLCENFNKLLSINLLVLFSLDRYLAICHMGRFQCIRSVRGAAFLISLAGIIAVILIIPIATSTEVLLVARRPKCVTHMLPWVSTAFIGYLFLASYCIPALLMLFFYTKVITYIRRQVKLSTCGNTAIPLGRVVGMILVVVVFYFICWTPFYNINVLMFVSPTTFAVILTPKTVSGQNILRAVQLFIHALPYVNCAFNWVFYALLNRELRQTAAANFHLPGIPPSLNFTTKNNSHRKDNSSCHDGQQTLTSPLISSTRRSRSGSKELPKETNNAIKSSKPTNKKGSPPSTTSSSGYNSNGWKHAPDENPAASARSNIDFKNGHFEGIRVTVSQDISNHQSRQRTILIQQDNQQQQQQQRHALTNTKTLRPKLL